MSDSPEIPSLDQWQYAEIKKAIAEADAGKFASAEEVDQVFKRWGRVRRSGSE